MVLSRRERLDCFHGGSKCLTPFVSLLYPLYLSVFYLPSLSPGSWSFCTIPLFHWCSPRQVLTLYHRKILFSSSRFSHKVHSQFLNKACFLCFPNAVGRRQMVNLFLLCRLLPGLLSYTTVFPLRLSHVLYFLRNLVESQECIPIF